MKGKQEWKQEEAGKEQMTQGEIKFQRLTTCPGKHTAKGLEGGSLVHDKGILSLSCKGPLMAGLLALKEANSQHWTS